MSEEIEKIVSEVKAEVVAVEKKVEAVKEKYLVYFDIDHQDLFARTGEIVSLTKEIAGKFGAKLMRVA